MQFVRSCPPHHLCDFLLECDGVLDPPKLCLGERPNHEMANKGQTVLVTGGAGFIGSHTCVALLEAGYDVVVVSAVC